MIYTVTLNPTIDRTMRFPRLVMGELNRASISRMDLSGKGINVSVLLRRFGVESTLLGFAAGILGRLLLDGLRAEGYACDFVEVEGETRSNITAIDEATGITTKLNEPGPTVTERDLCAMEQLLLKHIVMGDICVFSGSLPPGAPAQAYARLITTVHCRGARAILDTSGPALALGCATRPAFIKPNVDEAMALVNRPFGNPQEWVEGVQAILALGPERVLLSLGSRGSVLADGASICWGQPPAIAELSAVGAGDALMAAGLWAWSQGLLPEEVVRWAVASGTATAMEDGTSMPTLAQIKAVYAQTRTCRLQPTMERIPTLSTRREG